ncbi:MAG: c-type cytochrome [Candidatus Cloacimonetes bacterium]|nr:c-type cytochrome [Candidatus Cloacimonadota bacterium]
MFSKSVLLRGALVSSFFMGLNIHAQSIVEKGKTAYMMNCSPCHQADALGKVGFAPSIGSRDFLAIADDQMIKNTVLKGRAGTSMVGRPDLKGEQLDSIIAYLRSFHFENPLKVKLNKHWEAEGDFKNGKKLFQSSCALCHGENGEGYLSGGPGTAIGMKGFLDTVSDDYIYQTLKYGRSGTAMRPFIGAKGLANLTEQEAEDVIVYMRGMADEKSGKTQTLSKEELVTKGKALYAMNCSPCHQADGKGKPGFAPSIINRDFLAIASNSFIKYTISHGRPGTSMPARPDLDKTSLKAIIAYMRSVPVKNPVSIKVNHNFEATGDAVKGKDTYIQYCGYCHGDSGEGYLAGGPGPAIGKSGFLDIASDDYIRQTIRHGRVGTAMRPFAGSKGLANLNETEINNIIVFLRSLN